MDLDLWSNTNKIKLLSLMDYSPLQSSRSFYPSSVALAEDGIESDITRLINSDRSAFATFFKYGNANILARCRCLSTCLSISLLDLNSGRYEYLARLCSVSLL